MTSWLDPVFEDMFAFDVIRVMSNFFIAKAYHFLVYLPLDGQLELLRQTCTFKKIVVDWILASLKNRFVGDLASRGLGG